MSKKIVIAINYPIDPNRIGGMDRFFWLLNDKLKQSDTQITWIFPEVIDWSHYNTNGFENQLLFLPKVNFTEHLTQTLQENGKLDLLITIFLEYNSSYPAKWKKSGIRKIMVIDQMSRPKISRSTLYQLKYFLKGLINYFYIDRIVAVSSFVRKSILSELGFFWNHKVSTIYNSIDLSVFSYQEKDTNKAKPIIFCIAHLIEDKGVQNLIEAIHLLEPNLQQKIQVIIAGDGQYKSELQKAVSSYNLNNTIEFVGNINNQQEYLRKAFICVVPSLWKEAFGYTNVEAMAVGCTLIASNVGGIPEITEDKKSGLLFEPGDSKALSKCIENTLANNVAKGLKIAARKKVEEKFNLSTNILQYEAIIQSLII